MSVQSALCNLATVIFPFILLVTIPGGEIGCNVLHTHTSWEKGYLDKPRIFSSPFALLPPVKDQR